MKKQRKSCGMQLHFTQGVIFALSAYIYNERRQKIMDKIFHLKMPGKKQNQV